MTGIQLLAEREISYSMCLSKLAEVLEKILKAELLRLGWFLVKTHDLQELAGQLQTRQSDLLMEIRPLCAALAEKYFTDRYPGFDLDDPDWPALRVQVEQVVAVLVKVKARVK
jgi:HEPN domain-containing protein